MKKKVLNYVGDHPFNGHVYTDDNGVKYADINCADDPRKPSSLYVLSKEWEEPDTSVEFDNIEVTGWTDEQQEESKYKSQYRMLSRLQMDMEYWLGDGNRCDSQLYYKDAIIHVMHIHWLYMNIPRKFRPQWINESTILGYEREVYGDEDPESWYGCFKPIKILKDRMYASKEWELDKDKAIENYLAEIHKSIPMWLYVDYQIWSVDNLADAEVHIYRMVKEAFPELDKAEYHEYYLKELKEWKELNGM